MPAKLVIEARHFANIKAQYYGKEKVKAQKKSQVKIRALKPGKIGQRRDGGGGPVEKSKAKPEDRRNRDGQEGSSSQQLS